ncbi:hypothetical protein CGSSpBS455_03094 [Streptococcus pneumoniae BS455]|nr:hypothetical protein CGSSpBS455_03094 [Streptococcus pneumoniae BS455]
MTANEWIWDKESWFYLNLMAKWLKKNGSTILIVKPGTTSNLVATWRKMRQ